MKMQKTQELYETQVKSITDSDYWIGCRKR